MAGALLAIDGLYDGTLSGGSWQTLLPLSNAIVPRLSAVARTTNATLVSTIINRDYGAAVPLRLFAAVRPNLQKDALWKIRGSNNSDMSSPVYDSGWVACWPVQWDAGVLQPSDPNYSTRLFTNAQIAAYKYDVIHLAPAHYSARYWRIEFNDTANTDTYVQLQFLVMAPVYEPGGVGNGGNVGVGAELGEESTSQVGYSLAGVKQVDERATRRTMTLTFPALSRDEAIGVLRRKLRLLKQSGYVYVVLDSADTTLLQENAFLAQPAALSAVQLIQFNQQTVPVKLAEVL